MRSKGLTRERGKETKSFLGAFASFVVSVVTKFPTISRSVFVIVLGKNNASSAC